MAHEYSTKPVFNPSGSQVVGQIKDYTDHLTQYILDNVVDGRRRNIALTKYEEAAMWAVKSCFDGEQ